MTRVPERGSDRYVVVSADGHAGLPCEDYRPYLETRFHPAFEVFLDERRARREEALRFNYDYIMGWERGNEEGLKGAYDPGVRDSALDADGVAADLLFADADAITGMSSPPFGAGLLAGAIEDPELAFAGARAHNRFLAEMCAHSSHRRGGIALVPITHDVGRAVEEIEWVAAQPGIRGIMIPTLWRSRAPYSDAVYDPVWAVCAEASLPVHTHSGDAPMEEYGEHTGAYLAEVVWWAARPAWHLLFGGAFERHPDLKFVVTEAAAYWAPDMMWKWDQYMGGGHTTKKMAALLKGKISKLPSDYFGTNIFIGASTMSKEEIRRRYVIGTDVVMWGTDYPHPEGTWPNTLEKLRADFADVPVDDTAEMLGLTAAAVYGFDLDALAPVAARVGPSPDLLGQDPNRRSDASARAEARWWKAEYGIGLPGAT
jgi:predicted TIM-barrel fold metal-dependent hydrolase